MVDGPLSRLLDELPPARAVAVQAHDFPDVDALASAWALARLLSTLGRDARPVFRGDARSRSLENLQRRLDLRVDPREPGPDDRLVVVDASPSNGNITLFKGRLAGVVDHHVTRGASEAPFTDLRLDAGSCSTVVASYWRESGSPPPRPVATALVAGLYADTDGLSRGFGPADAELWSWLSRYADVPTATAIVKTTLDAGDLRALAAALASAELRDGRLFACLDRECNQEVLSVAADFVLRAEDISVSLVLGKDPAGRRVSLRSKDARLPAFDLVRLALDGIGSGGGHPHAAGGFVAERDFPGRDALARRFFEACSALRDAGSLK